MFTLPHPYSPIDLLPWEWRAPTREAWSSLEQAARSAWEENKTWICAKVYDEAKKAAIRSGSLFLAIQATEPLCSEHNPTLKYCEQLAITCGIYGALSLGVQYGERAISERIYRPR